MKKIVLFGMFTVLLLCASTFAFSNIALADYMDKTMASYNKTICNCEKNNNCIAKKTTITVRGISDNVRAFSHLDKKTLNQLRDKVDEINQIIKMHKKSKSTYAIDLQEEIYSIILDINNILKAATY